MAFLNSVGDKPFRVKAPPTSASALGIMAATLTDLRVRRGHPEKGLLSPPDLGPNLSVTGSLATSLWLTALRPEGDAVTGIFLKLGIIIMPPALATMLPSMVLML